MDGGRKAVFTASERQEEEAPLIQGVRHPLSLKTKLCFAAGGAPSALCNTVISFFLPLFLLEVAEIRPFYVSVIVFSGRAWDAITDPAIGYLCSRTRSRWGQLRPWLLFSIGPMAAAYIGLWLVPSTSNNALKLLFYLSMYCGFQTALSAYHVPYTALTMHLSSEAHERDSATAYRMLVELAATLFSSVSQGVIIAAYVSKPSECIDNVEDKPWLSDERRAYAIAAGLMALLSSITAFTAFIGVKEQPNIKLPRPLSFLQGLKFVLHHRPYVYLTMFFLFAWLGTQVVASNLALYIEYVLDLKGQFQYFIMTLLFTAVVSLPLWQRISTKIGKKATFAVGMMLLFPGLFGLLYVNHKDVGPMYVLTICAGIGISTAFLIPWSMLPDCIDDAELEFGVRREPLFYAFFVFFMKFAIGVALGLSTVALEAIGGYKTGECQQPHSVVMTLRVLLSAPGIVLICISFWFLYKYPIDTQRALATRKKLTTQVKEEEVRERTTKIPNGVPSSHSAGYNEETASL